jgi:hypothetical protein
MAKRSLFFFQNRPRKAWFLYRLRDFYRREEKKRKEKRDIPESRNRTWSFGPRLRLGLSPSVTSLCAITPPRIVEIFITNFIYMVHKPVYVYPERKACSGKPAFPWSGYLEFTVVTRFGDAVEVFEFA